MPKINRNDNVTIQNVANGQTQEMKKKAESNRFRTMGIGKLITVSLYFNKFPITKVVGNFFH
jgi:hypothetical protein